MSLNLSSENRENSVTSYSIEEDDQVSLAKSSVQNSGRRRRRRDPECDVRWWWRARALVLKIKISKFSLS